MRSIYEINKEYLQLADTLIEAGGEVTPDTEIALKLNREDLEVKGQGYAFIIKEIEADIEKIEAEVKRLNQQKKYRENAVLRLKDTIQNAMQLHEIPEIKTALMKINFRSSESVEISDIELIPNELKKAKIEWQADKKAIKAVIDSGEKVPGARVIKNQNLQIK
jgi:hypothetical protein